MKQYINEAKRMQQLAGIKNLINERLTFKDLKTGDKFLRFGENGQLWQKTEDGQAKFIKNVGKRTSKYNKKPGSLNSFPDTMDVTPYEN